MWLVYLSSPNSGNEGQPVLFEIHVVYNCCYLTCNYQEQKNEVVDIAQKFKNQFNMYFHLSLIFYHDKREKAQE